MRILNLIIIIAKTRLHSNNRLFRIEKTKTLFVVRLHLGQFSLKTVIFELKYQRIRTRCCVARDFYYRFVPKIFIFFVHKLTIEKIFVHFWHMVPLNDSFLLLLFRYFLLNKCLPVRIWFQKRRRAAEKVSFWSHFSFLRYFFQNRFQNHIHGMWR